MKEITDKTKLMLFELQEMLCEFKNCKKEETDNEKDRKMELDRFLQKND